MVNKRIVSSLCFSALLLTGCATESSRSVEVAKVATYNTAWQGQRSLISVGKFDSRFSVLDRANMEEIKTESGISGQHQQLKGATYVITGDVTEFGRKETGDRALFGILGRGKSQVAYAKVALNVVNVRTSEVVYSSQGAGEYTLSNREVLGFGGTASYDATLNGKVLDLAIREAVNNLVAGTENGGWNPSNTQ
ncbi:CsgG/HfaB family protein [Leclercia adecarboxylata ATCC 23216 = NBRC 102595]|nr:CsgG/HfaB family protein [Leclercia adecarboxylata ATCC 23216 = NBRC 102595]